MKKKKEKTVEDFYDEYSCHRLNLTIDCECGGDIEVDLWNGMTMGSYECDDCKKNYSVYLDVRVTMSQKEFDKKIEDVRIAYEGK